ncbi:MAG: hypothetical protein F6K40_12455 [Okeania sp. SIO3I5]|uniref:hypothetical protein n=1 Tax=Okeania sp. SIO3I5 TaxID=2607805 RepID=UPI0013BB005D|nr:hypothetical protein [Okeania sp. SIO3I5]
MLLGLSKEKSGDPHGDRRIYTIQLLMHLRPLLFHQYLFSIAPFLVEHQGRTVHVHLALKSICFGDLPHI